MVFPTISTGKTYRYNLELMENVCVIEILNFEAVINKAWPIMPIYKKNNGNMHSHLK